MRRRIFLLLIPLFPLCACGPVDDTTPFVSDGGCTDTWNGYGQSFFSGSCVSCHQAYSSHQTVQSASSQLASTISSGKMPKNSALTSSEKSRAIIYLRCGAP